jgi:dihydrofolate reductase
MISVIVAVADNGVIGGQNRLLWHISEDLRRFKQITMGHPVVMGRKTWDSLGRPLPARRNIVISRQTLSVEGAEVAHSLLEACSLFAPEDEIFIIGGAQIYEEAMPIADKLYLTRVYHSYSGDTYFPKWNSSQWRCMEKQMFDMGESYPWPFSFEVYERVR